MLLLPPHEGTRERERDRGGRPRPRRREVPARGSQQQTDAETRAEPQHADLVQQADSEQRAERKPEACAATVQDARHDEHAERPQRVVDRVHRVVGAHRQHDRRAEHGERRDALRRAPASHLAGEQSRQEHRRGREERRQHAQRGERVAEELSHDRQQRDREGRMVDVAPVEPLRAVEEVELVGHVAPREGATRECVDRELGCGSREQHAPRDGRPRAAGQAQARSCSICLRSAATSSLAPSSAGALPKTWKSGRWSTTAAPCSANQRA